MLQQLLAEQNLWAIVSLTMTVVLGIWSIVAAIRSKLRVEPRLYYENRAEISRLSCDNRKIIVYYGEQIVDQVTTTNAWFWNSGRRPIRREDIPQGDPIRLTFSDGNKNTVNILDFSLREVSRNSINAELSLNSEQHIVLSFDFLDHNDFIGLEVQHDGSVKASIQVRGVILGPKKRMVVTTDNYFGFPKILRITWGAMKAIFGVLMTIGVLKLLPSLSIFFNMNRAMQFLKDEIEIPAEKLELAARHLLSLWYWPVVAMFIVILLLCSYFVDVYRTIRGPFFHTQYMLAKDVKELIRRKWGRRNAVVSERDGRDPNATSK